MFSVIRKNKEFLSFSPGWEIVKFHIPGLYPVTACVVFGCVLGAGYLLRMAVQHPDAAWTNKRSQLPWLDVKHNEKKRFYSTFDYGKLKDERPKYE